MPDRPRRRIPGASDTAPAAEDPGAEQRPRFRRKDEAPSRANSGWGAVDALDTGGFTNALKITEEWLVLKFLEDRPFDVFKQHWFPEAPKSKGWRCLNEDGETPCPLCDDLGDIPNAANAYFNVAAFLDEAKPTLEVLRAPSGLTSDIKKLNEDKRFNGLTDPRLYFAVHRKDDTKPIRYASEVVRARDLMDEWHIIEPDAESYRKLVKGVRSEPIDFVPERSAYDELIEQLLKDAA